LVAKWSTHDQQGLAASILPEWLALQVVVPLRLNGFIARFYVCQSWMADVKSGNKTFHHELSSAFQANVLGSALAQGWCLNPNFVLLWELALPGKPSSMERLGWGAGWKKMFCWALSDMFWLISLQSW